MEFINKAEIREYIWNLLEEKNIAAFPRPSKGKIPNFVGSVDACNKLKELPEFKSANCVFCTPDYVLTTARELVLRQNKTLAIATPHMKKFLELSNISDNSIKRAASIRGFESCGEKLNTRVDLMVQGSVAVDKNGNRIGKGSGYGDREYQFLKVMNLIEPNVKVATVVHETQVLDDFSNKMNEDDVGVDYIITPERIIQTTKSSIRF